MHLILTYHEVCLSSLATDNPSSQCENDRHLGSIVYQIVFFGTEEVPERQAEVLRKIVEMFTFYSSCFLMCAMAVERWLYVCRPTDATSVLAGEIGANLFLTTIISSLPNH